MKAAQIAPPTAATPPDREARAEAAPETRAGAGWGSRLANLRTVKALRKLFGWRVRFSLRTLLLVVAALSAGIGAKLRFDENPWQQTWRWTLPETCKLEENCFLFDAALSNDGRRAAVILLASRESFELDPGDKVLLFDTTDPGAPPKSLCTTVTQDPVLLFDTRNRLLLEDDWQLLDAESGEELLTWTSFWKLEGVSEDGRTAVTSEESKAPYRVWDLDTKTLRCELNDGNYWLDGPRCTPAGTRGVTVRAGPESVESSEATPTLAPPSPGDPVVHLMELPDGTWDEAPNYRGFGAPDDPPLMTFKMQVPARVDVWDLDTGQVLDTFEHEVPVYGASLSRDGHWLLAGGDGWVTLWDVPAHLEKHTFSIDERFLGGEISAEGWRVLFETADAGHTRGCIRRPNESCTIRETAGGQSILLEQQDELIRSGLVSSDERPRNRFLSGGSRLVSWRADGKADLLDAYSGKLVTCLESPYPHKSYRYGPAAVARDRDALLFQDGKGLIKFERVRPEGDERLLWIPEFWLAAVFALAVPLSLWRDGRMKKA